VLSLKVLETILERKHWKINSLSMRYVYLIMIFSKITWKRKVPKYG